MSVKRKVMVPVGRWDIGGVLVSDGQTCSHCSQAVNRFLRGSFRLASFQNGLEPCSER